MHRVPLRGYCARLLKVGPRPLSSGDPFALQVSVGRASLDAEQMFSVRLPASDLSSFRLSALPRLHQDQSGEDRDHGRRGYGHYVGGVVVIVGGDDHGRDDGFVIVVIDDSQLV